MAFLVDITLCSRTLENLSCFPSTLISAVIDTYSARARTKKNTQKCPLFCIQNRTFLTEND